mgnify:CR=1 FL=1
MAYRVRRGLDARRSPATKCVASASPTASKNCAASSPSGNPRWCSTCSRSSTASSPTTSTWSRSSSCCASRTPAAIRAACCWRATSRCASSCSSYHRIPSPQFAVFRRGIKLRLPRKIKYPLFVKSTTEDASLGISQASIVTDKAQLEAAHPVRARPGADRRAGRGIHRGARAVRRRHGQRPPHAAAGVGDEVRVAVRELRGHRHAPREVGQEVPEETRHRHARGEGPVRRRWWRGSTNYRGASIARWVSRDARASTTA